MAVLETSKRKWKPKYRVFFSKRSSLGSAWRAERSQMYQILLKRINNAPPPPKKKKQTDPTKKNQTKKPPPNKKTQVKCYVWSKCKKKCAVKL